MKIKYTNGESSKSRSTNWGHLSGYQVYYVYSHENIKSGSSSFVYSADDSKASLTVWAKYLGESERSYLFLSENAMDYWMLMVVSKMSTLKNAGFQYFLLT